MSKCAVRKSCDRSVRWAVTSQSAKRQVLSCSTHLNSAQRWCGKESSPVKTWRYVDTYADEEAQQLELPLGD